VATELPSIFQWALTGLTARAFMEIYKSETRQIVNRFLRHRLSFPECISALDAALDRLIPRSPQVELAALRMVMLANNEAVMKEKERREHCQKSRKAG
jgi:hypothetical protein